MTVRVSARDCIHLEGACPGEDAETLLQRLLAAPAATVDLTQCESIHAAVLQVLLAGQPKLRLPADGSEMAIRLARFLQPGISH